MWSGGWLFKEANNKQNKRHIAKQCTHIHTLSRLQSMHLELNVSFLWHIVHLSLTGTPRIVGLFKSEQAIIVKAYEHNKGEKGRVGGPTWAEGLICAATLWEKDESAKTIGLCQVLPSLCVSSQRMSILETLGNDEEQLEDLFFPTRLVIQGNTVNWWNYFIHEVHRLH